MQSADGIVVISVMMLVVALLVIWKRALMTIVVTHEQHNLPGFLSIKAGLCSGNSGKTNNSVNLSGATAILRLTLLQEDGDGGPVVQ